MSDSNSTKKYIGFHDIHELPGYRRVYGKYVTIRKGTMIRTIGEEPRPAGRTYKVKVHHYGCGMNRPVGHKHHDPTYPVENPTIEWAGRGGYWTECDINDVDLSEFEQSVQA